MIGLGAAAVVLAVGCAWVGAVSSGALAPLLAAAAGLIPVLWVVADDGRRRPAASGT